MRSKKQEEVARLDNVLTVKEVAHRERVNRSTVLRWIEKGLPAQEATREQLGLLIAAARLDTTPTHGLYLIHKDDLPLIPAIRAYPTGIRRPRKGRVQPSGSSTV